MKLTKLASIVALSAGLAIASSSAFAQGWVDTVTVSCNTLDNMAKTVTGFNEPLLVTSEKAVIFTKDRTLLEGGLVITTNPDTGAYTVLFVASREIVCILASGIGFESAPRGETF